MKPVEIDGTLAEGHSALGTVLLVYDLDWARAEREFKRAIELNPNLARAHREYAWYLIAIGRSDEALREVHRAQELDPLSAGTYSTLASMYYHTRQYDKVVEVARKELEMYPNNSSPYFWLAGAYERMDMYDETVAARQKEMTLSGESPEDVAALGHAYEDGGIEGTWQWELERLKDQATREDVPAFLLAYNYTLLGEKDQAFEWLEKGYEQTGWLMGFLKVEPVFDPLRSDPRFQDLIRRMKFPE